MGLDDIKLSWDDEVLDYIVEKAVEYRLGARGLRSICESIMLDVMFDMPSGEDKEYRVTLEYARPRIDRVS
jgi:ATP-dependent Clp protease ATP-binding subunit ClpX